MAESMGPEGSLLHGRLIERLGETAFLDILASVEDNLRAYSIAREEGLGDQAVMPYLRLPEGEVDEETMLMICRLLDDGNLWTR